MQSSVSIAVLSDDLVQMTTIIDDKKVINVCDRPKKLWDMSIIPIERERFIMNPRQAAEFAEALESNEGRAVLNLLKNGGVESVINRFLDGMYNKMNPKSKLGRFIKEVMDQPLLGKNLLNPGAIGITRKEIFEKFVQVGLIQG